jgi:hypothetical protein
MLDASFAEPVHQRPFNMEWISRSRRYVGILAVGGLIAIGLMGDGPDTDRFAYLTLEALAICILLAWIEVLGMRSSTRPRLRLSNQTGYWGWAIVIAVGLAVVACQSWFKPGTVIAVGDVGLPNGTEWLNRVFAVWVWSGSNLGGPSALELQLPFAVILWTSHALGGTAEVAQRVWFTTLFGGAALGSVTVLLLLGIRRRAAVAGAVAYTFSPFVLANAIPNPVYLAALALLPIMVACVLAGASGRLSIRRSVLLMSATAPVLGYVYLNPPLLGMVISVTLCTPLAVGVVLGRSAAVRALTIVAVAVAFLSLISAYWIIPSAVQLIAAGPPNQLTGLSSWAWTEGRANLQNGFWLNTTWAWAHPEYFPFAPVYGAPPFSVIKYVPAIVGFAAFIAVSRVRPAELMSARLRLAALAGTIALAIVVLSTGTNPPGNVVFDRLYALPLGWLLREPGRFLMVASLMYAVLIALTLDRLSDWRPQLGIPAYGIRARIAVGGWLASAVLMLPGIPIFSGSVVPDTRPTLPPEHVVLPTYWYEMTRFIDSYPRAGAVLILPPDDYYQMPYDWGYFGNDQFIGDLMHRSVVNPTTGYFSASDQLTTASNLVAQGILDGNWLLVQRLLNALGSPMLLIRRDLKEGYVGRTFLSADDLANSLAKAPNLSLIHQAGPLELFGVLGVSDYTQSTTSYLTVGTASPDLRILSRLPDNAALITSPPLPGVLDVQQVPGVAAWQLKGNSLQWSFLERPRWTYSIVQLDSLSASKPINELMLGREGGNALTAQRVLDDDGNSRISFFLPARDILTNGGFQFGLWEPVGDCNNVSGGAAQIAASVPASGGPEGGQYLRLTASLDTACEYRRLTWSTGPVFLSLKVRHIAGDQPQICLWEVGPDKCASVPQPTGSREWVGYQAAIVPDQGTSALELFVYAAAQTPNVLTENDYAEVRAAAIPIVPQLDVIGAGPESNPSPSQTLVIDHTSFSTTWRSPSATHVLVDGVISGWLANSTQPINPTYWPNAPIQASFILSIGTASLLVTLVLLTLWKWAYRLIAPSLHRSSAARPHRS